MDGRDILIGGRGKDQLDAGNGHDILVGGRTLLDDNAAALVLEEWDSSRTYNERVTNIRSGSGPVLVGTGFNLEADVTVLDDNDKDELQGSSERDWFFASLSGGNKDDVKDKSGNESLDQL